MEEAAKKTAMMQVESFMVGDSKNSDERNRLIVEQVDLPLHFLRIKERLKEKTGALIM